MSVYEIVRKDILDTLVKLLVSDYSLSKTKVKKLKSNDLEELHLIKDCGVDSLSLVEVFMYLEEWYDLNTINYPENDCIIVKDIIDETIKYLDVVIPD